MNDADLQEALGPADIKGFSLDDPAVRRRHRACPDILIISGGRTLGGAENQKRIGIDAGYDWGGVTTHG